MTAPFTARIYLGVYRMRRQTLVPCSLFAALIALPFFAGSVAAQGLSSVRSSADTSEIELAVLATLKIDALKARTEVIFNEAGQSRSRPLSADSLIRARFGLGRQVTGSSIQCHPTEVRCASIPANATVVDIGPPRPDGEDVVVVVRLLRAGGRLNDGTFATTGSIHTFGLRLVRGTWTVVSHKATFSG